MNILSIECGLCDWKAGAADEKSASLVIDWHLESVHGLSALADAIIDDWISEDEAIDAETEKVWRDTITIQDAAFLHALKIIPT